MANLLNVIDGADEEACKKAFERPAMAANTVQEKVEEIMQAVKAGGDAALQQWNQQFGAPQDAALWVTDEEWLEANNTIDPTLRTAIDVAATNIQAFHKVHCEDVAKVETMAGVCCWRKTVGIEKVGLYIPGGTAPLFSTVLMLGIPSQLANCNHRILATPPAADGKIHPAILYAAQRCGITRVLKAGGAQAIAAMTYGTETVPAVHKIFGPGNQYVTESKQQAQMEGVAIDMPAGPSEVLVMADGSADPEWVAADLLSQCEHGADSQCLLLATPDFDWLGLQQALKQQIETLPRQNFARQSLSHSHGIVVANTMEALRLSNAYAPEHLIIATEDASLLADGVCNAGSVFIGHHSPESAGDYASGTNHTLPTNGAARGYSGVSVDSFVKKITFQQLTAKGLKNLKPTIETMAMAEGLDAHARAVSIRFAP